MQRLAVLVWSGAGNTEILRFDSWPVFHPYNTKLVHIPKDVFFFMKEMEKIITTA